MRAIKWAMGAALVASLPNLAQASPWTLGRGDVALSIAADGQTANREWLIDGSYQRFPLAGRFFSAALRARVRIGLSDRIEIGMAAGVGYVGYQADELYFGAPLVPEFDELTSNEEVAANLTSLDRSVAGLTDVEIFFRARLLNPDIWRVVLTPEITVKLPTGYDAPVGTFQDDDFSEGVADDVTLGDGQADITIRMLAGFLPHPRFFVRLDGGIRIRLFGPGQQVVAGFKLGGRVTDRLIPYAGIDFEHTFTEGKEVGTTFATATPDIPAAEFTADDLLLLPYRLDRSSLRPSVGLILAFDTWELDLSYRTVVWGINMAQTHGLSVGSKFRF